MVNERAPPAEPLPLREDRLAHIPRQTFVAAWAALVGEPPVMMLANRSEMIRLLVDSTLIMPLPEACPPVDGALRGARSRTCGAGCEDLDG